MKKLFSSLLVLFAAVSLYAADLNIYASGLKASQVDNMCNVEYILNAPATTLELMLYTDDITSAMSMSVTDPAALTKGAHTLQVALPQDVPAGVYHWAMKVTGAANDSTMRVLADTAKTYTRPRGLDVDKDPESPSFGNIYIADALGAVADGLVAFYPASMDKIVELATNDWSGSSASPMRVTVGEDHLLYVTDWSDNAPNIHIVDPQNPTAGDKLVFGGTKSGTNGIFVDAEGNPIHGSMSHCYVTGQGANRVLYTFDEDMISGNYPMGVFRYDIGELTTPWASAPSTIIYDNADHFEQNGNSCIFPDGKGGWWISQYRAADNSTIPMLIHLSAEGIVDFNSSGTFSPYNRGGLALNAEKTQLASPADGKIDVYDITWNEDVPSLTLAYSFNTGVTGTTAQSCYNVAFDYAGNLYATYDDCDIFAIAPAKADNSCVTPAPERSKVYIGVPVPVQHLYLIGDNTGWDPTSAPEMANVDDNIFEGVFTFTNDTNHFAFLDALAEVNDGAGWDYVNAHRYAGDGDAVLLSTVVAKDTLVKVNNTFRIPQGVYRLRVDFNTNMISIFRQGAVVPEGAMYIAFKDVPGKEGSDDGNEKTALNDIVKTGADLVSEVTASKVYMGREGCGVKFGTKTAAGSLTLTLVNSVTPAKIIVNAVSYGATEGSAILLGDTVDLTQYGNKVLVPYVKEYDGLTAVSELTFATTAKRMYLLDVIIIPAENVEPFAYKIKHPWDVENLDPWIWKACEEQEDGTWALTDVYMGGGCNIDPKVLEQDWISTPTLVGNPYVGDSCVFVINPNATEVAGILTITKLGEPNVDITVYEHLYEIGDNQGWHPAQAIEMTNKSENVFEGTFEFTAATSYFAFITVKPETDDWTVTNANRFGGATNNELIADGGTYNLAMGELNLTAAPGKYTITVNLNDKTASVVKETEDGLENINGENNVQKVIENGHVYIIRDGVRYTATGARVE